MIDKIITDIIEHEFSVPTGRIVVNNQGYKPEKDFDPWYVISYQSNKIVGNSNVLDPDADEQVQKTTFFTKLKIEVRGKSREVITNAFLIPAALNSDYAIQKMEENNIRIFRAGEALDLSEVDGASSLHRWRIPVTITHMVIKRSSIVPFENFQTTEVVV